MNLESEWKESVKCRENHDMKIAKKCEKSASVEKEASSEKPRRYLIGFGMLTKTSKSLYAVHYE